MIVKIVTSREVWSRQSSLPFPSRYTYFWKHENLRGLPSIAAMLNFPYGRQYSCFDVTRYLFVFYSHTVIVRSSGRLDFRKEQYRLTSYGPYFPQFSRKFIAVLNREHLSVREKTAHSRSRIIQSASVFGLFIYCTGELLLWLYTTDCPSWRRLAPGFEVRPNHRTPDIRKRINYTRNTMYLSGGTYRKRPASTVAERLPVKNKHIRQISSEVQLIVFQNAVVFQISIKNLHSLIA